MCFFIFIFSANDNTKQKVTDICLGFLSQPSKGPIIWRISAQAEISDAHRAEILLQLHGEFQPGCSV